MRQDNAPTAAQDPDERPQRPIRTCVGCRVAEPITPGHLRVVFDAERSAVVPDRRRQLPGRGAWVHRDPKCLRQALDRKAFGRALKVPHDTDVSALQELAATGGTDFPSA